MLMLLSIIWTDGVQEPTRLDFQLLETNNAQDLLFMTEEDLTLIKVCL